MRSIWTRVRESCGVKADPAQVQGAGSGEGAAEVKPTEIPKVEPKAVEEVKTVESASKIDNVPEQAVPKPETVQIATQTSVSDANTKVNEVPPKDTEANKESVPDVQATVVDATATVPSVPAAETKVDEVKSEEPTSATLKNDETQPQQSSDWQQREQELLNKIEELEKFKKERTEDGFKLELKVREEEIDLLKARVKNLETELQAALSKPGNKNHELVEKIKVQHEELLSKARGMIFDKTKMVKNQELQIEALTTQVQSLKDINQITKDLLEIRNSEVKAMEERLQVMEARFKAEKERYELVLRRAQTSTNINDDLRREYETQLALFKELRAKYELRVQALVAENNRLKELPNGGTSG
ncbi:protein NETWORKED 1D-like isoform X1 [Vanessa atalanta]|uniref:protein NETWORKED 1D-like isoform X1 n=1 Tax=Vanessa atalanta TaxID=42275 RepID=UPI001FCD9BA5|nr:protein NETWORKED 1D-like isoform X1 [Vanessa atalanta]